MKVSEMLKRYSCMFMAATMIVAGIPQTTARADEPVPYDLTEYETNELPEDHLFGVNVAFQKKVIAKVGHEDIDRNNLVDGNTDSFTEITAPVGVAKEQWQQYFIVDLGKDYVIDRAKVCWRDFGYASEYQIQVATDESVENAGGDVEAANVDWATVGEETDYKAVVDKEEKEYTFAPIAVRYVKLNCTKAGKDYFYHVRELSVYTVGSKTLGGTKLDVNQNNLIDKNTAKIIGNRSLEADPDFPNEQLIDKDESTTYKVNYWNEQTTSIFLLDLGKNTTFNMIKLVPGTGNFWAKRYQFFVATEEEGEAAAGEKNVPIYEEKNGERTVQYCALGKEVTARYIMFKCVEKNVADEKSGIDLNEIELFNVTDVEPTELIVAPTSMSLTATKTTGQISTMINPVTANKRTMEYTSKNPAVAEVDENGLVSAKGTGETVITAKIAGTNISKDIKVAVGKAISPAENVTVKLANDNKFAKDVTISWDPVSGAESYTVLRFKENSAQPDKEVPGLTTNKYEDTKLEPGDYSYQIITIPQDKIYSQESASERSHSVVIAKDAIGITGTPLSLNVNETKKLKVDLNPPDTTYDDIIWESLDKDGVIKLDEKTGKVTGLKVGTAQVKATLADYKTLTTICEVTVGKVNVESITLDKTEENMELSLGDEVKLTATVAPENATYQNLTWKSSKEDVATVSADGTITTKAAGNTTITVTSDDNPSVRASIDVKVIQRNAESIVLNESSKTLVLGEKFTLKATVNPDTATFKEVEWKSSAPQYASVGQYSGEVTANQVGEATITAYCGKVEKTCKIIVERPKPDKITIISSGTMDRMEIGKQIKLEIVPDPINADASVEWSTSNEEFATIDDNGTVTAISAGPVTITAKAKKGGQTAKIEINVVKPAITSMHFAEEDKNITMFLGGEDRVLKPVIEPKDAEQKVTYDLDKDGVVFIDEDGNVNAVGVGKVKVTATSLDFKQDAEAIIYVKKPPVEQIKTSQSDTANLVIGETLEVEATTLPEKAEKVLNYTSTNPAVATVDPNGTINAVADGQTKIVIAATDESGITTSFDVIVRKPDVSAITLDQSAVTLSVGSSTTLRATVEPALANQAVEWASSNPAVATVDANGNVTALAIGTATITATAEGKVASCTVTAHIPATKLTLNTKKVYIVKGKKLTVKGVMTPANTTDKITWTTANKKIATVTSKGKIKAKKVGNTTITATTTSGKKVNVKVYVVKQATPSTAIKLNKKKVTIKKGSWYLLSPTLTPSKSTDTIKWKSSKKKVASVDKYGFVTAKKKGKAVITATTKSGKKVECTVTVK